jgi:hypothetical protein
MNRVCGISVAAYSQDLPWSGKFSGWQSRHLLHNLVPRHVHTSKHAGSCLMLKVRREGPRVNPWCPVEMPARKVKVPRTAETGPSLCVRGRSDSDLPQDGYDESKNLTVVAVDRLESGVVRQ